MSNKSFNFTKSSLSKIQPPGSGRDTYKDSQEKGLILIVGYGGSKVFYLYKKIAGRPCRIKISPFPDLSVAEARRSAAELKRQIVSGNTALVSPSSKIRFKELFDRYINDYAKIHKKSWKQDVAIMNKYGKSLYGYNISAIERQIVQQLFNKITSNNGKVTANRFLSLLCTIFNYAIKWDLLAVNPTLAITKHTEKSRDRYLISEELPRFFKALEEEPNQKIKDFILMSLYTGARQKDVLSMNWQNISFEDKTWYIRDPKNGQPQLVPLIDEVVEILEKRKFDAVNDWVFPSDRCSASGHLEDPTHIWESVLERAEIEDLVLHDLRRTMGSWMARAGGSSYIIGKALNHKTSRSTDIYARLCTSPVREYMNKAVSLLKRRN